jgi:uncharacterized protein (DUF1778 family)
MTITTPEYQRARKRPLVAAMRVTPSEMDELRDAASRHGQSLSDYLRSRLVDRQQTA